jgi:putative chitinase
MSWVSTLQERLRSSGHDPGRTDGHFGPRTMAATLLFMGCRSREQAEALARPLVVFMGTYLILDRPERVSEALGEWAHESGRFNHLVENLSYSAAGLMRTWPGRFPDHRAAAPFVRQPERLANHVYADRMGNGPPESGDGWRFRGRGLSHTTGRANYSRAAIRLGLPLLLRPELLEEPEHAVRSAVLFWDDARLNQFADRGLSDTITRRINGGTNGLEDRRQMKARMRSLWQ